MKFKISFLVLEVSKFIAQKKEEEEEEVPTHQIWAKQFESQSQGLNESRKKLKQ